MKHEWLNNREPLPVSYGKRAGNIAAILDFEDGESEPQRIYAGSEAEMNDKLIVMYGGTRNTLLSDRRKTREQAAPPPIRSTPPTPSAPAKMTTEEKLQAVADLEDPAKAGAAMAKLMAEEGFDIERAKREQREADSRKAADGVQAILASEVKKFMEENPDFYGSPKNGALLRDRTFARVGKEPTAADWAKSFEELEEMGVLESAPVTEPSLATPGSDPSDPPTVVPRSSTGARPSLLQRGPSPVPAGSQLTRSQALDLAESDDYDDRIRREPGFKAKIEKALSLPG